MMASLRRSFYPASLHSPGAKINKKNVALYMEVSWIALNSQIYHLNVLVIFSRAVSFQFAHFSVAVVVLIVLMIKAIQATLAATLSTHTQ